MIIRGNQNPFLRGSGPKKHIKARFFEGVHPFEGLSERAKKAAVAELAKRHVDSFSSNLERLKEICRSYNFFQLLTHFSYYDQILLDGKSDDASYEPVEQSAAELLQALILQIPEKELQRCLELPPPPQILLECNKLLREITLSFGLKRLDSLANGGGEIGLLSEMIRGSTAGVRNPGFASQIRRTMMELFAPLDVAFETKYGLKPTRLATMLWNISDLIGKRLNEDFRTRTAVFKKKEPEQIISGFLRIHPHEESYAKQLRADFKTAKASLRDLRSYLTTVWDSKNFKLFELSRRDWAAAYGEPIDSSRLDWALSILKLSLGELEPADPEHFFLDNPVWLKPIIKFGPDHYLLPLPAMIQSFGQEMIEAVIRKDAELWEKYQSKIRPKFLEDFTSQLFKNALPSARILKGISWTEAGTSKRFETDILVILDTHTLIIECKAGHVSGRARRGDAMRLKKDVKKLIEEPTIQSQRFSELLSTTKGFLEVEDADGAKHTIDASRLLRISRLNVTLEYFGQVGFQARLLRETGMVSEHLDPVATMPMHELENVVEVLEHSAFIFHYLHRRAEIEATVDLLTLGEGGLLAMYLATGFDLDELERPGSGALALPNMQEELAPYFMGKEIKRPVTKPKRRFTRWWNDILSTLERRAFFGWLESSYGLLSVGYERQQTFERGIKKLQKGVAATGNDGEHKNAAFLVAGSPKRRVVVLCVVVKNITVQEQRENVIKAFRIANEKEPTSATLAIVRSVFTPIYPYSAIYFLRGDTSAAASPTE